MNNKILNTNLISQFSIAILLLFILLAGCKKDKSTQIQGSVDDVFATSAILDIFSFANEYAMTFSSGSDTLSVSPMIYVESDSAKVITFVDFQEGFINPQGKTYSGKINFQTDSIWNYSTQNKTLTVNFETFKIDNIGFSGSFTILFDTIASGIPYILITGENIIIQTDFESQIKYSFEYYITWYSGFETPVDFTDDGFIIAGISNGTSRNNRTFSAGIKPDGLFYEKNCSAGKIVKGTKELMPYDAATQKIEYGSGECDHIAIIYHDGETFSIEF